MFNYLDRIPFFRLVLAFACGIRCCDWLCPPALFPWISLSFLLLLLLLYKEFRFPYDTGIFNGAWLFLFFGAGFVYTSLYYGPGKEPPLPAEAGRYLVHVNGPPVRKSSSIKVPARLFAREDSAFLPADGFLYFRAGEADTADIRQGDILQLYFRPELFRSPANLYEFNLKRYYARKGIQYTGFIQPESWRKIGNHTPVLADLRQRLVNRVHGAFNDPEEADVAAALVFGYEDDIDASTKEAFQKSGITHVLAVSGLHVSIIWWLLSKVFFFLGGKKWKDILRIFIILAGLWLYAAITDFAPSILRATVMFSFLMWAGFRNKGHNGWNILFVSAFFILLLSPAYLFDAGFWLSYLAVGGIMYFVPRWQQYTTGLHPVLRTLADLLVVTLAAQLSTVFYTLHVFGTFPNWFLLNNMIAVPLSSVALFAGLAYCMLADVPWLTEMSGLVFELSTRLMMESARFFEKLPYSYTEGISFSLAECLICYLCVGVLAFFARLRRVTQLYLAGALFCLLLLSFAFRMYRAERQHFLLMYALRNGVHVEYVFGRSSVVLYSRNAQGSLNFSVQPFHRRKLLAPDRNIPLAYRYYRLCGQRMLFLEHTEYPPPEPAGIWHICTRSKPRKILEQAPYRPRLIVLHGMVPPAALEKWKAEARRFGIPVYVLQEQGMCIWQAV